MVKNILSIISILAIGFLLGISMSTIQEKPSPSIRIGQDNLAFLPDKVVISYPGIKGSSYSDTNSLDPYIDDGMTGLSIPVNSETKLYIGDIISYKQGNKVYTHIISAIEPNSNGNIYIVNGTYNKVLLSTRVSHEEVLFVKVGNIY